jgi:predicted CXXCH cytochrome family protein
VTGGGTQAAAENDTCLTCHAAQRGPWVFEHEALREGCTVCHAPHGSVNDKMLTERDATLCLKCHFQEQTDPTTILIGGRDHTAFPVARHVFQLRVPRSGARLQRQLFLALLSRSRGTGRVMSEQLELSRTHVVAVRIAWGAALIIVLAAAAAASADVELKESRVTVSGTGIILDGDEDQFRQRHGVSPNFVGGIEDLHMEWGLGNGTSMVLDGRGMFDNSDYLARLRVEKSDKGYVTAGYREFRTYYDGTGGFFPPNSLHFSYFDEDLRLDRGEAWFEAGLRLPNVPKLTARYAHMFRDGQKSSTEWADTGLTGGLGLRNIVPAILDIDERRDIIDFNMEHDIRATNIGGGFRYEHDNLDDKRSVERRPGEAQDRFFTQKDNTSSNVYGVHLFQSTPFLDNRIVVSSAYAYDSVENDLGGSRVYGAQFDPAYDPNFANRQPFDEGFLKLNGSTRNHENVGTLDVQGRPSKHFYVTGGFRAGARRLEGNSAFTETNVGNPPTLTSTQDPTRVHSETDNTRLTESAEARYTGIPNWVLYTDGEWTQEDADLFERQLDLGAGTVALERLTGHVHRAPEVRRGRDLVPVEAGQRGRALYVQSLRLRFQPSHRLDAQHRRRSLSCVHHESKHCDACGRRTADVARMVERARDRPLRHRIFGVRADLRASQQRDEREDPPSRRRRRLELEPYGRIVPAGGRQLRHQSHEYAGERTDGRGEQRRRGLRQRLLDGITDGRGGAG